MVDQTSVQATERDPESSASPADLPMRVRLAMVGLPATSLVLAWGLVDVADLPVTSYIGLALLLTSLATMFVVAVRHLRHDGPVSRKKD